MRIALFSEAYWPMVSGVAGTLMRTADALLRRGHQVRVYSATYPLPPGAVERPEVHRSPSRSWFLSPEVQWASTDHADITTDLRRFDPDVVHLATEAAMGYAGLKAAKTIGAPIIASAHTDYERYAPRYGVAWATPAIWLYLRWFYRQAERVLAPSEPYRAHLVSRGIARTGIWTRGVETDTFSPVFRCPAYRAELGIGPDDPIVAYVGRIAPEKGIDRLLDAWGALARRHPTAHLVFTGHGLMESAIRERTLPRVHLTGVKRGRDLAVAYASADVFAMPSVTETFGNVTLEAMASGLAVVAVAAGGVLDFGRHDDNAWLAGADRPDEFAFGLDRVLADPQLRSRLAARARDTALARSWGPVFDGLVDHYRAVAGVPLAQAA